MASRLSNATWVVNGSSRDYSLMRDYLMGPPKATKTFTVEELKTKNIVGYYRIKEKT